MEPRLGALAQTDRGLSPRIVPVDRRVVITAALLLAGSLASTGWLAAWFVRPPAAEASRTVEGLAGYPLVLPAAWFVRPGAVSGASANRLDLTIPWSALTPDGGGDRMHVTVTRVPETDRPLGPARRYARFLTAEVQATAEGLMRRRFRPGSPFDGEDLFLAQPDGNRFAARCAGAQPDPQGACLSEIRIGDLSLRLRFAPERLPSWEGALTGLERLFGSVPASP